MLFATRFHGGTTGGAEGFTWWSYLVTEPGVLVRYLRLAFWPVGLCFDYGWPPAKSLGEILWPGLLIVGLLGVTIWSLLKRPRLGFVLAAWFLLLAPMFSFIPIRDAAVEHRMYLPLAGDRAGCFGGGGIGRCRNCAPAKSNAADNRRRLRAG